MAGELQVRGPDRTTQSPRSQGARDPPITANYAFRFDYDGSKACSFACQALPWQLQLAQGSKIFTEQKVEWARIIL